MLETSLFTDNAYATLQRSCLGSFYKHRSDVVCAEVVRAIIRLNLQEDKCISPSKGQFIFPTNGRCLNASPRCRKTSYSTSRCISPLLLKWVCLLADESPIPEGWRHYQEAMVTQLLCQPGISTYGCTVLSLFPASCGKSKQGERGNLSSWIISSINVTWSSLETKVMSF